MSFFDLNLSRLAFWRTPVSVDAGAEVPQAPVEAQEPVDRPNLLTSFMGMGCFPGFEDVPPSSPALLWKMRCYPALVLAHTVATAPILAGTRSIEVVDDGGKPDFAAEIKDAATKDLLPIYQDALAGSVESLGFGHWLQEVVWDFVRGRTVPVRLQSFVPGWGGMPGEAVIHVDQYRQFIGYQVGTEFRDARYGLLSVNEPHIDPILGHSRLENAKSDWWRAVQSNKNGDKIERKASGIQMMLAMMIGKSFVDSSGNPIMPEKVLREIMAAAAKGESFLVPLTPFTQQQIASKPELANIAAVKVDKFDWGQTAEALKASTDRIDKCDRNMIRAYHRPERESTEGKNGNKAESSVVGQLGVMDTELVHDSQIRQMDAQLMKYWKAASFKGAENIILRTVPAPLSDPQQEFLQKFAEVLATDTNTGPSMLDNIDTRGLLVRVEAPVVSQEDAQKSAADRAAQKPANPQPPQIPPTNGKPINGDKKVAKGIRALRDLRNAIKSKNKDDVNGN